MKIKKIDNKQSGFSMFELLVVISIMAILTAVAVVSFGGLSKKTRDSRRINDLEKIRLALEGYKQINGVYPTPSGSAYNLLIGSSFLEQVPKDPKTGQPYYINITSTYTYQIGTSMEDLGSTNCSSSGCGTCGSSCNYRLVNP